MCEMTSWLSYSRDLAAQRETLQRMTDTLAFRGPNAEGLWIDGPIGLGHRRLSIIDLERGHQPMVAHHGGYQTAAVISYTGEVYNFQELRRDLQDRGHRFGTRSDTEVVLRAYLDGGMRSPSGSMACTPLPFGTSFRRNYCLSGTVWA